MIKPKQAADLLRNANKMSRNNSNETPNLLDAIYGSADEATARVLGEYPDLRERYKRAEAALKVAVEEQTAYHSLLSDIRDKLDPSLLQERSIVRNEEDHYDEAARR